MPLLVCQRKGWGELLQEEMAVLEILVCVWIQKDEHQAPREPRLHKPRVNVLVSEGTVLTYATRWPQGEGGAGEDSLQQAPGRTPQGSSPLGEGWG